MRMFFSPDEENEYEATRALLVDRFQQWAREKGLDADPFIAESALDYRHRGTPDGRLGLWEPRHVEEFLTQWLPRTLTVLPGQEPDGAPETLRALLRYLDAVHLADPRGACLADSLAAVDTAGPHHVEAMADRGRWGMAKFWATTAAEQGVDILDQQAMQRFVERAREDKVPYDREALDTIVQRHLTYGPDTTHRAEPQLPVELPSDETLREQAERSSMLGWLRGLTTWAGREGRVLTGTGRLRLTDARELVEELGTGDTTTSVRSSADLPHLNLTLEWAKTARLVRVSKGRLYAVAKAQPLLKDPLALWRRVFEAFFKLRGPLIGARGGWRPVSMPAESMLFLVYEEVLSDVLATLYSLPHPMPWPRLRDSVHLAYRAWFELEAPGPHSMIWLDQADRDLRTVLAALEHLGAVECRQGMADPVFLDPPLDEALTQPPAGMPPELAQLLGTPTAPDPRAVEQARQRRDELASGPVTLIRLTDLGTESVRRRLLAEGRDAPLIGELAQAPASGVLGVLSDHYDPDSARVELTEWIAGHDGVRTAVDELTDAVRAVPFRARADAMLNVLAEALDDGEDLVRSLRADASLAPTALSVLVGRGLITPDDLTEAESVLMVTESLLQLLETAGPEGMSEVLREQGLQAEGVLAAALASDHPDRAGVAELQAAAEQTLSRSGSRISRARTRRQHGKSRKKDKRRR